MVRRLLLSGSLLASASCAGPHAATVSEPSTTLTSTVGSESTSLDAGGLDACEAKVSLSLEGRIHADLVAVRASALGPALLDASGSLRPLVEAADHAMVAFVRVDRRKRAVVFHGDPARLEQGFASFPDCRGTPERRCDGWLREVTRPAPGCVVVSTMDEPFDMGRFTGFHDEDDEDYDSELATRHYPTLPAASRPHEEGGWIEGIFAPPRSEPSGYRQSMYFATFSFVRLRLAPTTSPDTSHLDVRVAGLAMGVEGTARGMVDEWVPQLVAGDAVLARAPIAIRVDEPGSASVLSTDLDAESLRRIAAMAAAYVTEELADEETTQARRWISVLSRGARRAPRPTLAVLSALEPVVRRVDDAALSIAWRVDVAVAGAHGSSAGRATAVLDELVRELPDGTFQREADDPLRVADLRDTLLARLGDRTRLVDAFARAEAECDVTRYGPSHQAQNCAHLGDLALEAGDRARVAATIAKIERLPWRDIRTFEERAVVADFVGRGLLAQGKSADAVRLARDVRAWFTEPMERRMVTPFLTEFALAQERAEETSSAIDALREILDLSEGFDDAWNERRIATTIASADAFARAGREADARERLDAAGRSVDENYEPASWFAMRTELDRLRILARLGDDVRARFDALLVRVRAELRDTAPLRIDAERGLR